MNQHRTGQGHRRNGVHSEDLALQSNLSWAQEQVEIKSQGFLSWFQFQMLQHITNMTKISTSTDMQIQYWKDRWKMAPETLESPKQVKAWFHKQEIN